jgi:hypothetical protein
LQETEETLVLAQSIPVAATRDITFTAPFDFSTSGDYQTTVYITTEDPHFYKATSGDTVVQVISVNSPAVELGEDISTVRPDTVVLRAYSGVPGQTYLWQDSSTDSLFNVSTDGLYHVRVTNGLGCVAYDTIQVLQLVKDVGVNQLVAPLSACELADQLPIEIIIRNFGTDTVAVNDTIFVSGWINQVDFFSDYVVMTEEFRPGETFNFIYSRLFDFSTPGTYDLKLYTTMQNDITGSNDTLDYNLEVFGYPDVDLGPDTTVLSAAYLLSAPPGYAEYLWQDGSTGETFNVTTTGTNTYYVTVSDANQCTGWDTVEVNLNVLDVAMDQLLAPATSCELSESITVSARIRNAGNQAIPSGETIHMGYSINDGPIEQDQTTLSQNLLPGATIDFTFSKTETVTTGQWYDFVVFVDYMNDNVTFNDTVVMSVGVFEAPDLDLGEDYQVVTELEHTLDAGAGFATYEWQDGSTDQTFLIDQPGIGSYWVTVTDVNGCVASDSVTILLAIPDVGVKEVIHPTSACTIGDSEQIQVAIQNFGNYDIEPPASITVSYSLNGAESVTEDVILDATFGNGEVINHTFSLPVDFSSPGRYEIVAFTEYASDRIPTNDIVMINIDHLGSPVVDIGDGEDTILISEPITLSATPGYPSYLWQDGSTGTDFEITGPSAGTYWVEVTAENGCQTRDSVFVAYDLPDLGIVRVVSPESSCGFDAGTTVSVEVINNGYYHLSAGDTITLWYSVDGGGSVFETAILESDFLPGEKKVFAIGDPYDFSAPRSYSIRINLFNDDDSYAENNQLETGVTVWGYPSVEIGNGEDTIRDELPVTLDTGGGFSSYLWKDNSTASINEVTVYGWHWVTVTDENGCPATDSVYVGSVTSVDEWPIQTNEIRIYPNPVNKMLHVDFEREIQNVVTLELYSIARTLVFRQDIRKTVISEASIDVQKLTPGTYYLRVIADEVPHHFLVIVEH